jgi:8-oxo-dGTP diphosphatase
MSAEKKTIRVVAAILTYGDEILVCRRAQHKVSAGLWEFPGGKIESGESARSALVREIKEELGIDIEVGELFDLSSTETAAGIIQLECYFATCPELPLSSSDHDALILAPLGSMTELSWASPDLPAVAKLLGL